MSKHLWVTPYQPRERYAAGDYPEPAPGRRRLARLYQRVTDRSTNTDVVVWYTFGAHHIVRPEDWPVMPVSMIGFHAEASRLLRPQPGPGRPTLSLALAWYIEAEGDAVARMGWAAPPPLPPACWLAPTGDNFEQDLERLSLEWRADDEGDSRGRAGLTDTCGRQPGAQLGR